MRDDDRLEKLELASAEWRDLIPPANFEQFVDGVMYAAELYLGLEDPKATQAELEKLEKALRSPTNECLELIRALSDEAKAALSRHELLPREPEDPSELTEYFREIRSRLVLTMGWKQEGTKRRRQINVVGGSKQDGRPPAQRIAVLVSFVCTAFARATGRRATRSWSDEYRNGWRKEAESDVERIITDLFANLEIDEDWSPKKALQRQIGRRH